MSNPHPLEQQNIEQFQPQAAPDKAALESKIDQATPATDQANAASFPSGSDAQQMRAELPEKSYPPNAEAEAKLRQLDQTSSGADRPIPDSNFVDKAGRDITVRTWTSGDSAYIRAYDGTQGAVPENVDLGTVGRANVTLQSDANGATHARLNDIEVNPSYRGAGISPEILGKAEQFAQAHNATEIYGSIDSPEAQNFWQHMESKGEGWNIDPSKGYYGEVHKTLN